MIRVQTFGLLKQILTEGRGKGHCTVPWSEFEGFLAQLKVPNAVEFAREWAAENFMWVDFEYSSGQTDRRIVSVSFGSSK